MASRVTALRAFHEMSRSLRVQQLSHAAFRWLYVVVTSWNGFNNGAIEFKRREQRGPLAYPEMFEKARREVLATGLIIRTRIGGRNLTDNYAIAIKPIQVSLIGTATVPTNGEILGTATVPTESKTGTATVPSRYGHRTKENGLSRRSRAHLNRNAISKPHAAPLSESHGEATANPEPCQGEDNGSLGKGASIPPLASRH